MDKTNLIGGVEPDNAVYRKEQWRRRSNVPSTNRLLPQRLVIFYGRANMRSNHHIHNPTELREPPEVQHMHR